MGAKIQAFDIFQTPLSSHYPLPLTSDIPGGTEHPPSARVAAGLGSFPSRYILSRLCLSLLSLSLLSLSLHSLSLHSLSRLSLSLHTVHSLSRLSFCSGSVCACTVCPCSVCPGSVRPGYQVYDNSRKKSQISRLMCLVFFIHFLMRSTMSYHFCVRLVWYIRTLQSS